MSKKAAVQLVDDMIEHYENFLSRLGTWKCGSRDPEEWAALVREECAFRRDFIRPRRERLTKRGRR